MIERPWGVTAYGAASVKSMPDLVRARFRVIRVEQTPSDAFAAANDAVHQVREALRRHAVVAAARRKAELYAEAAEVRLGAVVHIEDVDPERAGTERHRGHGSGGAAAAEDLAPGHVLVSAAVILGFSITHE